MRRYCPFCKTEYGRSVVLIETERGHTCHVHGEIIDMKQLPAVVTRQETAIVDGNPNKFYAGAKHIGNAIEAGRNAACTRATFEQAVEDARDYMQRDESLNTVVIVEIVAVIHREKPAVTVTKFRE